MKIDDRVKVSANGLFGKVVEITKLPQNAEVFGVKLDNPRYGDVLFYERHEVQSYIAQSEEDFKAEFTKNLPIGLELANEALAKLFSGVAIKHDETENELSAFDGRVTISAAQLDQKKIGGLIQRTGYKVTEWTYRPATRWHDADSEDSSVGVYPTIKDAVKVLLATIFKLQLGDYWAEIDTAKYAEEV